MLTPLRVWRRVSDDIAVWAATLAGIVGSILWPVLLDLTIHGTFPVFHLVDLGRLLGASIIAIVLAARADKEGTPEQRSTKAAVARRVNAAFARGWSWQGAIAALTAAATGGGG